MVCLNGVSKWGSILPSLASLITTQQQPSELKHLQPATSDNNLGCDRHHRCRSARQGRPTSPAHPGPAGSHSFPQPNVLSLGNFPPSPPGLRPSLRSLRPRSPAGPAARPQQRQGAPRDRAWSRAAGGTGRGTGTGTGRETGRGIRKGTRNETGRGTGSGKGSGVESKPWNGSGIGNGFGSGVGRGTSPSSEVGQ